MNRTVDTVMRDTLRYYYEDGFVEIAVGLLFLAIGILLQLWVAVEAGVLGDVLIAVGSLVATLGAAVIVRKSIQAAKVRVTYPRTGYVAYRTRDKLSNRWIFPLAFLCLTAILLFVPERYSRMSLSEGLAFGLVLIILGHRLQLKRFYLLAALSIVIGVVTTVLFPEDVTGSTVMFVGAGILLIISGFLVLVSYLRRTVGTLLEERDE